MSDSSLRRLSAPLEQEMIAVRRDLHAHPEIARTERRTTQVLLDRLERADLKPRALPGTGLTCEIGSAGPIVALRADLDALPLAEDTGLPFTSTVPGVAHACGHDVHTAIVLGAGLLLARRHEEQRLPGRVRLLFQAAEEVQPGGALDLIAAGALDGVGRAFGLHCDPHLDVGLVGSRVGALTSACDNLTVRVHGSGGHTSRPHLTQDVVYALAEVVTQVPAVLTRRLDPRSGVSMVWGQIHAGMAPNAIPRTGEVQGTLRCLDSAVWAEAGVIVADVVRDVTRPFGVQVDITHTRGVPPTVNEPESTRIFDDAVRDELGPDALTGTSQSLGGEDFGWMLEKVPGAMVRLGTRTPGGATFDLHRPDLVIDERAIDLGVRLLAATALGALAHEGETFRLRSTPPAG